MEVKIFYLVRYSHSYQCCFCRHDCLRKVWCDAVFEPQQMLPEVGNSVPKMHKPTH